MRGSLLVLAIGMCLPIAVAFTTASPARAHAVLERSVPVDGARLPVSPETLELWFSEPLDNQRTSVELRRTREASIIDAALEFPSDEPSKVLVNLQGALNPGHYTVEWETISAIDGHSWTGSFVFIVLNPDRSLPDDALGAPTPGGGEGAGWPSALEFVARWGSLLGAMLTAGIATFLAFVLRPGERTSASVCLLPKLAAASGVVSVAGGLAELLIAVGEGEGTSVSNYLLHTQPGIALGVREALFAASTGVLLLGFSRPAGTRRGASVVAALGLAGLLAFSASSHSAAGSGRFWTVAVDGLHLGAAAVWLGGLTSLAVLFVATRGSVPERLDLGHAARRFSVLAALMLASLIVTGVAGAITKLDTWGDLVDSTYGWMLIAKLALVAALIPLAAVSHWSVSRRWPTLSRAIVAEAAAGVAIVTAAAMLVLLPLPVLSGPSSDGSFPFSVAQAALLFGIVLAMSGMVVFAWATSIAGSPAPGAAATAIGSGGVLAGAMVIVFGAALTNVDRQASTSFEPTMALRNYTESLNQVALDIAPFEVGENHFKVALLDRFGMGLEAERPIIHIRALSSPSAEQQIQPARGASDGYRFDATLASVGWWQFDIVFSADEQASFWLRLDNPSQAPLKFGPAIAEGDAGAEALFERTVAWYQSLRSLRYVEHLTSGLTTPQGDGVAFLTNAKLLAPASSQYAVRSSTGTTSEQTLTPDRRCLESGGEVSCSDGLELDPFDLDYLDGSIGFESLGTSQVDGRPADLISFYTPGQQAWYLWWMSPDDGALLRRAMVAPGHFMVAIYAGPNEPVDIRLPAIGSAVPDAGGEGQD